MRTASLLAVIAAIGTGAYVLGQHDGMTEFIKEGEWGPGFNAQNNMLDAHAEKYNLQDQDWRSEKVWYKAE